MALDGLLRVRSDVVSGILNGIDDRVWNPATDPHLAATFTADAARPATPEQAGAETALRHHTPRRRAALRRDQPPLGAEGARPSPRGAAAAPRRSARDLVVVGSGDAALEQGFRAAAKTSAGRVGVFIGYDEALAHLVQGGADALLVPSRFEPCGLTQLCALRYGAVPVVARVGGLNDTVIDANEMALSAGVATGFQFSPVTREALEHALTRATAVWRERRRSGARCRRTAWRWRSAGTAPPLSMRNSIAICCVSGQRKRQHRSNVARSVPVAAERSVAIPIDKSWLTNIPAAPELASISIVQSVISRESTRQCAPHSRFRHGPAKRQRLADADIARRGVRAKGSQRRSGFQQTFWRQRAGSVLRRSRSCT